MDVQVGNTPARARKHRSRSGSVRGRRLPCARLAVTAPGRLATSTPALAAELCLTMADGTASRTCHDDEPRARLPGLPPISGLVVLIVGADRLTVRIDLDNNMDTMREM